MEVMLVFELDHVFKFACHQEERQHIGGDTRCLHQVQTEHRRIDEGRVPELQVVMNGLAKVERTRFVVQQLIVEVEVEILLPSLPLRAEFVIKDVVNGHPLQLSWLLGIDEEAILAQSVHWYAYPLVVAREYKRTLSVLGVYVVCIVFVSLVDHLEDFLLVGQAGLPQIADLLVPEDERVDLAIAYPALMVALGVYLPLAQWWLHLEFPVDSKDPRGVKNLILRLANGINLIISIGQGLFVP